MMMMMKSFWLIMLSASLLLLLPMTTEGAEETVESAVTPRKATTTKTVYGFLDFTTTVSDTVMIFKPSKSPGQSKGRSIVGNSRTASVLLSKPAKLQDSRIIKEKINSSPPTIEPSAVESETLPAPTTEDDSEVFDDESTGRSGNMRGLRPRPRIGQVEIEGSLVFQDESASFGSGKSKSGHTERLNKPGRRSRLSSSSPSVEVKGTGSVVSMFSVMNSQVEVSSRVDIRIGGSKATNGVNKLVPKQVEVRTEVKLAHEDEEPQQENNKRRKESNGMQPGQSLVSKSVGTRIQNGMTTVHETSIIGTTIDGQYAHFVQSTSRVFQETSTSIKPAIAGTVEVVTELPSVGHSVAAIKKPIISQQKSTTKSSSTTTTTTPTPEATTPEEEHKGEDVDLASLPSLESLFGSVNANSAQRSPDHLSGRKKPNPDSDDDTAVVLKPSFRVTPAPQPKSQTEAASTPGNIERRAGLASPPRVRDNAGSNNTPRPIDQRWRYNPSPKPKVAIHRGSGSGTGSRFRDRAPATTSAPIVRDEDDPYGSYDESYQEAQPDHGDIDPTEVITLRVQTTTPVGYSNLYYEVATIKSPYIMRLGAVRNTRYVTLTRTFTRLVTPTPAPSFNTDHLDQFPEHLRHHGDDDQEVLLNPSRPLPDPENILATTAPYENILKDSSDTATLPAIIVAATESGDPALDLQTVTETFSTTELAMKTSILPYLRGGSTSHMTLTQSYYITRVVVAVKTVPPPDLYQFIPSKTLTDISTNLQEAGSEHINDRLLPGELEFSENDEYDEEDGPRNEKRVPAPSDFDLSNIGKDFDLTSMDKGSPYRQINLEPSLVDTAAEPSSSKQGTPPLPSSNFQLEPSIGNFGNNNQGGHSPFSYQQGPGETPMLSPEQLQQLALFRYMNPYAAAGLPFGFPGMGGFPGAGGAGVQVIQTSRPVVKTIDVIKTETVPIWDGAKTFYSTIKRNLGTTVVTETEYGSTTVAANPLNQLFPQQFTVVSTPVVTEITTTSTELRIYRIIFRAQTTYTTVTSTSVFPTVVTTYVTNTIPIQPTAFPQGIYPGSFGGYPNFG